MTTRKFLLFVCGMSLAYFTVRNLEVVAPISLWLAIVNIAAHIGVVLFIWRMPDGQG